jgi:hypothetical protein
MQRSLGGIDARPVAMLAASCLVNRGQRGDSRERQGVVICICDGDQSARLLGRTIIATGITGPWASSSANRLISML